MACLSVPVFEPGCPFVGELTSNDARTANAAKANKQKNLRLSFEMESLAPLWLELSAPSSTATHPQRTLTMRSPSLLMQACVMPYLETATSCTSQQESAALQSIGTVQGLCTLCVVIWAEPKQTKRLLFLSAECLWPAET